MKKCIQCNLEKEKIDFYNNHICISCINNESGIKTCTECKEDKKLIEFYKKQINKFGIESVCKKCMLLKKWNKYQKENEKDSIQKDYTPIDVDLYKEFINDTIETADMKCKLNATLLYKLYKKYVSSKNLKYTMIQSYFQEKMEDIDLLGKYEKAGYHGYKLKDNILS